MKIKYSIIKVVEEINILSGQSSFEYNFNQNIIDLLKKNFVLPDSLYILAKNNNEFVAFCSIDKDWWEDKFFFIREILVSPKFQRQNIGRNLLNQCIEHARNKGATGVVTETAFNNIPMQKLCSSLGFIKWDNPE